MAIWSNNLNIISHKKWEENGDSTYKKNWIPNSFKRYLLTANYIQDTGDTVLYKYLCYTNISEASDLKKFIIYLQKETIY